MPTIQETKVCAFCVEEKPTSAFSRNAVNFRWGAKDGLNIYCKKCLYSGKSLKRIRGVKPLSPEFEARNKNTVLRAIEKGAHTREALHEVTGLDMDELVDLLAHLVFEKRKLRTVRVGEDREFHLAA